jgi:hypothetical protein
MVTFGRKPSGAARAILLGTLVVGVLDAIDAVVFFGLRGVSPLRCFQAIASGLLGRAAFQGGALSALLGAALHFFIACGIVSAYYVASGRLAVLTRRPILCGLLYGVFVYFFMNDVVLPLSAVARGTFSLPVFLNGVIGHALLVGVPSAVFARLGRGESPGP